MTRTRLMTFMIFSGSLFLFLYGIAGQEVIGFESRFYLFAREMWEQGLRWFPTTYFLPYPDYPGASVWLIYFSSCLLGGLTKFSAVLPTAIAAALTVTITYRIALLLHARDAMASVLLLFFTFMFLKSARSISLDIYPTLFTAASFYLVCSADVFNRAARIKWIYPLFLLSFLFRGPLGLVMPTGVVCIYYLFSRQYKLFFMTGFIATILLLLSTGLLLLLANQVGGALFVQDVLRMEVLGRMQNGDQPFYFYFVQALWNYALSYPIALCVMMGLVCGRKIENRAFFISLAGWVCVILIGMSIPGDKKMRYVLSMAPALAILAAYPILSDAQMRFSRFFQQLLQFLFFIFPSICLFVLWVAHHYFEARIAIEVIDCLRLLSLFVFAQVLNVGYYFNRAESPLSTLFVATTCFYIAYVGMIEPIDLHLNRARDFVSRVEKMREAAHAKLIFYKEGADGLAIKYRMNMPVLSQPVFIENEAQLMAVKEPAYFVTNQSTFDVLLKTRVNKWKVIAEGHMGHSPLVIFTMR